MIPTYGFILFPECQTTYQFVMYMCHASDGSLMQIENFVLVLNDRKVLKGIEVADLAELPFTCRLSRSPCQYSSK